MKAEEQDKELEAAIARNTVIVDGRKMSRAGWYMLKNKDREKGYIDMKAVLK